ncbi:MAG: 4-hydroxy-tetrahydrodipicolinate synthase [Candidatus Latescibacterota bacterium]
MRTSLRGIIPPVVTPFHDDDTIDESGFSIIIDHLIKHGAHGVFLFGGQGEGNSLSRDEIQKLTGVAMKTVQGRVPVLVGTGAITTRDTIDLTRDAKEAGADFATILTPFFITMTQEELYRHYCRIADAVDIKIIIYSNPARTQINLQPQTVARMCEHSPNIAGIKDSSGDLCLTMEYKRACPDYFSVFTGRDQLIFSALCAGLDGAVPATSNAAIDYSVAVYNEYMAGNLEAARQYQEKMIPLREFFPQGGYAVVVKEALNLMGLPAGPCRSPVMMLSVEKKEKLRAILKTMKLI